MDKLELDARMVRLERRVGLHTTVLLLAGVGLGIFLTLEMFALRASSRPHATVISPPPLPAPAILSAPAPHVGMAGFMPGMIGGDDGSMPSLQQKLTSLKQMHDERLVAEAEWKAMKAKAFESPLTQGDLRSDLQAVQQLFDARAICDTERAALRAKLLGIAD
jgi:hypothetical protein